MKNLLLAGALSLAALAQSHAQTSAPQLPRCGFDLLMKRYAQQDANFKADYNELLKQRATHTAAKGAATVYYIPVVFHVVYNIAEENVPDSVLYNQLDILNGAYRKTHVDADNVREVFAPLSADAEIEFYLATEDPEGNPTTGITRTSTDMETFGSFSMLLDGDFSGVENIKQTAGGGHDAWDARHYLNIWVADMSIPGIGPALLGYATPPLNPLPPVWGDDPMGLEDLGDGVVLQYHIVGNNNPAVGVLSTLAAAGRTAVHEVGHYLGLRHIWGDPEEGLECTGAGDDGMADTPPMANQSANSTGACPSPTANSCTADTLPDMWENYMDYSNDKCQAMFTHDQVSLMRSVLENQRDTLVMNGAPTSIPTVNSNKVIFSIYPQPAHGMLHITFSGAAQAVQLLDMTGRTVRSWDGKTAKNNDVNVTGIAAGTYILSVQSKEGVFAKRIVLSE